MCVRRDGGGDLTTTEGGRPPARADRRTHMSREMLAHADEVPEECAYDGMVVEI